MFEFISECMTLFVTEKEWPMTRVALIAYEEKLLHTHTKWQKGLVKAALVLLESREDFIKSFIKE